MKFVCAILSLCLVVIFAARAQSKALKIEDNTPSISHRIVGGEIAKPNQFPYQVLLKITKVKDGDIAYDAWCGGSLIFDKVVLSAAHCLTGAVSVMVYLGAHNREADEEPGRITMTVDKLEDIVVHEEFDPERYWHDIGLVILPEKVKLTDKIKTIELHRSAEEKLVGKFAITSGWGRLGDRKPASDILRFVQRKIFRNEYCGHFYGRISDAQLCVDGQRKSICSGDSGGPLTMEDKDGKTILIGITSFGAYTCEKDIPTVFTKTSSYLDWISKHTGIPVKK